MSRSLGDRVASSVGVICDPEILELPLEASDKFIVIASDGVFEFISSEEAVELIVPYWKRGDYRGASEALAAEAQRRWVAEADMVDDITCIVMFLSV